MFVVGIRTVRERLVVSEFRDALRKVVRPYNYGTPILFVHRVVNDALVRPLC